MNSRKYRWILYTIVVTIVVTLCVQAYWNYKNYLVNKRNFSNEVQQSLDNALEEYFKQLAKTNSFSIIATDKVSTKGNISVDKYTVKGLKANVPMEDSLLGIERSFDTLFWDHLNKTKPDSIKGINVTRRPFDLADSLSKLGRLGQKLSGWQSTGAGGKGVNITSIFISFREDTLDFAKLDTLLRSEFSRRDFKIPYGLTYKKKDTVFQKFQTEELKKDFLSANSKSTFLKEDESLEIAFPNASWIILRYSFWGIMVSFFLALVIMAALLYLLQTIRQQKQLSEIKDDFISNITHEFKTPIANINAALEGMSSFNVLDDRAKAQRYVEMSRQQLGKLTVMVEKILETATLETSEVQLKKENLSLSGLLHSMVSIYAVNHTAHKFEIQMADKDVMVQADHFHLENALNNVLDNAVKYGGELIKINLSIRKETVWLRILDNGGNLTKEHAAKVFEKFYRVPKGNIHDVKGFGIGLYYTRNIIEKHGGQITVSIQPRLTIFEIQLPYGT